jgi:hypothetical protein
MTKIKYNYRVLKTNNSNFYSNREYLTLTVNYLRSPFVRTLKTKAKKNKKTTHTHTNHKPQTNQTNEIQQKQTSKHYTKIYNTLRIEIS